ncbi:MAG: glycosyltransferase family 4 protein [Isosphaeraceae bacterium]
MYTPESQRGHARYTRELLRAMAACEGDPDLPLELVTCSDLAPEFRTDRYSIQAFLPPLVDRSRFRTRLHWGISRVAYYLQRERAFLKWTRTQPDLGLVHFQEYTPWLAPWHFPWLRRRGIEVVATVHNISNFQHASIRYMQVSRHCWQRAWRSCSALVVHTEGLRKSLSAFLGGSHPPIHITPHGVWEERTSPPTPPRLSGPGEPVRLLFFGAIRRIKGLSLLLQAMEQLPECSLTIAGEPEPGEHYEEALQLIRRLPPDRVEFEPRYIAEHEIEGYFDRAQIVVLPYTEFASQSGVLHQALAHGRPVVASAVGGLGESVEEWGIGELVPPRDAIALAEGIRRLFEPMRYRAAVEAVARERTRRTWARQAEATLGVYRSLLA